MADAYKLRCTLLGHSMDVRGVASGITEGGKDYIVSGSRDKKTKIWTPSDDGTAFEQYQTCEGHTNFVSCVCVIPPSPKYPKGLILSGGHDHTILGFEIGNPSPLFHLIGHKGTVCSIAATSDLLMVTGSWDQTAKVWCDMQNVATLTGHSAAVWAVASIPSENHQILTGSADREIRLWIDYQPKTVFKGHEDCVRALAVLDRDRFLSGSNDSSIRMWNISQGETMHIFYGHTNFIYSIALLPNGQDFVSVGEDRALRVWSGSNCKQVIYLPATSIWSVATLQNGDVVTGSSDGTVRVFTNDPARFGNSDVLKAFEEEVSKTAIATQQDLGGMKISELPGPESLLREGKKDGETKMVREGDQVGCYSWSAAEQKWNKIGDVVGASGATQNTSGKVLHEGKEYDYVFTVDLDGQGTLKLPYNISEDPWFAAQKFIHKNELSQLFLDQVAKFIVDNTKGMQLGTSTSTGYADPFTGGNRYVPGTGAAPGGFSGGGAPDPFTGSGAYTTSSAQSTSAAPPVMILPSERLFPVTEFLRFAAAPNYDALTKKLTDFIQSLGPAGGIGIEQIDALLGIGRSQEWKGDTTSLVGTCLQWPADKVFPILDLLRLGVLNPQFAQQLQGNFPVVATFATRYLSKEAPTNQMLCLRLLCNVFGALTSELMRERSALISQVLNNMPKAKTNEVAASTLLLNYSIVVCDPNNQAWSNVETQTEMLMAAASMLEVLEDGEAVFRTLVAVGNLVSGNPTMANLFQSLSGTELANRFIKSGSLPKIQQCATQIKQSL
ncbi:Phospholipase A-2-activating protein [Orchesella cincta]|uniref:Phospholipase A-2-activating protein n=1 Tax=Orchesella cincta TaxID=48709 RepID=A0A1D2N5I5_ORCCI|nr:Phospholipase A-2-activating protein [Orchesella cincta]